AIIIKQSLISLSVTGVFFLLCLPIDTSNITELDDRLGFTICCLFVSALSIVMCIVAADMRGNSDPIDASENLVNVPSRILQKTTEQFLLHMITMLTLTLFIQGSSMIIIPILSAIFLIARTVYQFYPIIRGYALMCTFLPTMIVYTYCTVCCILKIFSAYDVLYT
uniref:Uncharacterized protein n=1 Tax=Magallana gigas TaxID=29159 RepID=A0A8W8KYS5_MAGGI